MRPDHLSYTRLLKAAALGAVIGLLFDLVVTLATSPTKAFSVAQVPSSVAFLLVGFAGGWLFELFKAQTEVTDQSQALSELIKASINANFRSSPDVGVAAYFRVLSMAINHAERYEGIQRNPFRSYRDTQAGHYLDALREKMMITKTRVVLVDDEDVGAMTQDSKGDDLPSPASPEARGTVGLTFQRDIFNDCPYHKSAG